MKCPNCGKVIPGTVKYCAYCGSKVEISPVVPSARCGASLGSVAELAQHFYQDWDEGKYHLYRGDIEAWLRKVFNRTDLEQIAVDVRQKYKDNDEDAGLQELLDLCGVPGPTLKVDSDHLQGSVLDLGQIDKGGTVNVTLTLSNSTWGYLYGEVLSSEPWLRVSNRGRFACPPANPQTQVTLELNTEAMREITSPAPVLEIRSNDMMKPTLIISLKVLFNPKLGVAWTSGRALQPPPIDFGEVAQGEPWQITRTITLTNIGGRTLQGTVHPRGWLRPHPSPFSFGPLAEGTSETFDIVADPTQLDIKRSQLGQFPVKTNVRDEQIPAKISIRKWWFTTFAAFPMIFIYSVIGLILMWILANFVIDLWWYGIGLIQVIRSAGLQYATRVSLLGITGASVYLLKPLIEEIEYYYFEDKFQTRLPTPILDRKRTIFVTVVLTLMGLVIGGIAGALQGPGEMQAPVGFLITAGAAGALGVLTTTKAYAWITRQPLKTLRSLLLVFAASVFYTAGGYIVSSHDARYLAAHWGGLLGAMWGLFVIGSESSFWPPVVRVRLRQIAQAWLAVTLGIIGFYGLDIFRCLWQPSGWNIPTQIHFPQHSYDTVETILGLFGSFVLAVISSCGAFGALIVGLSAGALADSDVHTSRLRKMGIKAWQTLPLGDTLKTLWQSTLDGKRLSVPDFSALRQLYTQDVQRLIGAFTHWPGTSERNWATTIAVSIAYLLAGYLALVGGISLAMIPVMIVVGIIALIIYIILAIVAIIIGIIIFYFWASSQ